MTDELRDEEVTGVERPVAVVDETAAETVPVTVVEETQVGTEPPATEVVVTETVEYETVAPRGALDFTPVQGITLGVLILLNIVVLVVGYQILSGNLG